MITNLVNQIIVELFQQNESEHYSQLLYEKRIHFRKITHKALKLTDQILNIVEIAIKKLIWQQMDIVRCNLISCQDVELQMLVYFETYMGKLNWTWWQDWWFLAIPKTIFQKFMGKIGLWLYDFVLWLNHFAIGVKLQNFSEKLTTPQSCMCVCVLILFPLLLSFFSSFFSC